MFVIFTGHDILRVAGDISGSVGQYNMSGIKLTPGVVHYTNVIAYNYAGAHTTASSDGFMIDSNSPALGIVYDELGKNERITHKKKNNKEER